MRFIVMHKVDADMESGAPPDQDIIQNMGKLIGDGLVSGTVLDGAGLHRSAKRARLRVSGGEASVTRGPLEGENELVAGFCMIKARSMDDAIGLARRFAEARGDQEIEIGPVVEAWDIGIGAKPPDVTDARYLLLFKADRDDEAGVPPSPARVAAMDELSEELARAGVLLMSEGLTPSSKGARLARGPKGKRSWVDGPFAESKELVAGFAILDVPSRKEAIAWADQYVAILGDTEVDVREMVEPPEA
jgi:hypothetical protein